MKRFGIFYVLFFCFCVPQFLWASDFKPMVSSVLKGSMEPEYLVADITGVEKLYLITKGIPNNNYAQSAWGEAVLKTVDGEIVRLCDLEPVSAKVGWGQVQKNKNVKQEPLKIGSKDLAHGVFAHADSIVCYALDKKYVSFAAYVGIESVAGTNGGARFTIDNEPHRVNLIDAMTLQLASVDIEALQRAVADLSADFPQRYNRGEEFTIQLKEVATVLEQVKADLKNNDDDAIEAAQNIIALQREILLSNPLLDFDELLLLKRLERGGNGIASNWTSNCTIAPRGWQSEIIKLSIKNPEKPYEVIFKAPDSAMLADVDLDFDLSRMLFSMPDGRNLWQVWQIDADGGNLKQLTPGIENDVHNYDACYLPSGRVIFNSTASMVAVPCIEGLSKVSNLYLLGDGQQSTRQLCFDQEHNWNPTVLNNGRVLYTRWEYTDTPHSNTRLLFHMNPDGTNQTEYYGSNSYWPNSIFYTRPIPNHPTKVVGVVTGHHGVAKIGELIIFDPARGRFETQGVVQRIPGFGQTVEPIIADNLVDNSWPKFAFPYPLSEKYFLVTAKLSPRHRWGIYLVDIFDNMLLIKEMPGYFLAEPLPFIAKTRPPVIPDTVDLNRKDATVFIANIYEGPGLAGIPKGTVKSIKLFSYTYAYDRTGGLYGSIGMDGPWDIRRVLGTVPVEPDGSATFKIPANTPVGFLPLDADGKALAIMRSWTVGMPGEFVSCIGCHESQNTAPPSYRGMAMRKKPAEIKAWYGPTRGFAFYREVQPVLDKYCSGCHDGSVNDRPYLKGDKMLQGYRSDMPGRAPYGGRFSQAYADIFPYVRGPGIESDYHLLTPMEFHADTTELVQMLHKGHNNVELDEESWDRLYTWIDMNTPYHGSWATLISNQRYDSWSGSTIDENFVHKLENRRAELRKKYANVDENHLEFPPLREVPDFVMPVPVVGNDIVEEIKCDNWPFASEAATVMQDKQARTIDFGDGITVKLMYVPAGQFVMGSYDGHQDERPVGITEVEAFWMAELEITNEVYARFNPAHNSKQESRNAYQFGVHGYKQNDPQQPAIRLNWYEAMEFCQWLSAKTGYKVNLPTEAQWEWACRAGTDTPFSYGDYDIDFSKYANLADAKIKEFAEDPYYYDRPIKNPSRFDDYIPKDERFNDGAKVTTNVGSYQANRWGLKDMHGNAAEWTRSLYMPYGIEQQQRNATDISGRRVVRGGSWRDRPKRSTSSYRLSYQPYHKVFNVGFRIVIED